MRGRTQVFEKGNFAGVDAMRRSERLFNRVAPMGVADITMAVQYTHVPRPPLRGVPLTSFDGLADATIERGNMAHWRAFTDGPFRNVPVAGDHYFITTHFREARSERHGMDSYPPQYAGLQSVRNIYSPSHSIDVKNKGEKAASVSFETSNNDNDFQLFYGLSNNDFGMSLLTYREAGKDGYFLLQLSPKDNITEKDLVNKDIIFVLDTSGSMADEGKMVKARSALLFGIRNLRDGDRFNVVGFAGEEHLMESGLIRADASGKKRGEEFVGKLTPTGGTNINDALKASLRQFDSNDRPKLLVFMTDGLPTVGEQNVEKIINNAKEIKVDGLRLFTFGVGYDVNTRLLDKLAAENSGAADYIEPKEDLEVKVSNFFTKVNSPVLTDLELDFGGVITDLLYPRKLTDIFKGTQLTLIGRYKNVADIENISLRLKGKAGKETRTFEYKNLDFPFRTEANNFLPRLWATRRVGWLVEQIRSKRRKQGTARRNS